MLYSSELSNLVKTLIFRLNNPSTIYRVKSMIKKHTLKIFKMFVVIVTVYTND